MALIDSRKEYPGALHLRVVRSAIFYKYRGTLSLCIVSNKVQRTGIYLSQPVSMHKRIIIKEKPLCLMQAVHLKRIRFLAE
jgi:hypothetical protein